MVRIFEEFDRNENNVNICQFTLRPANDMNTNVTS